MRISDWSSDVCSSDLADQGAGCEGEASDHFRVRSRRLAQMMPGIGKVAPAQFTVVYGALGQQPCDHVHQPRRDFQGFAGKTHAEHDVHFLPVPVALLVEIGARLIRHDHGFHIRPEEHTSEEHTSELQSLMRTSYAV